MSEKEFLKTIKAIENKENFIVHLKETPDATQRLAHLNLVEPTSQRPNFKLHTINNKGNFTREWNDRKASIKAGVNNAQEILEKVDKMAGKNQGMLMQTQDIINLIESSAQKGRDMPIIGRENLNADLLAYIVKNHKKNRSRKTRY